MALGMDAQPLALELKHTATLNEESRHLIPWISLRQAAFPKYD